MYNPTRKGRMDEEMSHKLWKLCRSEGGMWLADLTDL